MSFVGGLCGSTNRALTSPGKYHEPMAVQYIISGFFAAVLMAVVLPSDFGGTRLAIFMLLVSTGLVFGWIRRNQPPPRFD